MERVDSAPAPAAPAFGVEIETVGRSRDHVARAILAVVGGHVATSGPNETIVTDARGRRWACVPDASLSQATHAEIVTPILTEADLPQLQDVVRAVRASGAQVDGSTACHVHIDGAPFDARAVKNLLKIWNKQEPLIFQAFRVSASRRARHCKDNDPEFMARLERARPTTKDALNTLWYGRRRAQASLHKYDPSRYHAVNLHSLFHRGTIEFRLFEGSLRGDEVKAYVEFVLAIAKKALSARAASSRKRTFNPDTAKYDFRVFLLHLGFIGEEHKQTREILTKHLRGSAAWKNGRPQRSAASARVAPTGHSAPTGGLGGMRGLMTTPAHTLVFAYGSLLRGEPNHRLLARARLVVIAITAPRYLLVDLGAYPAMLDTGRTAVRGEVFACDAATLTALDRFEGHPDLYERRDVVLARGPSGTQAYFLKQPRPGAQAIRSGDWRAHLRERDDERDPAGALRDIARGRLTPRAIAAIALADARKPRGGRGRS